MRLDAPHVDRRSVSRRRSGWRSGGPDRVAAQSCYLDRDVRADHGPLDLGEAEVAQRLLDAMGLLFQEGRERGVGQERVLPLLVLERLPPGV